MKRIYQISFVCLFLLGITGSSAAQMDKGFPTLDNNELINIKPRNCWDNQMRLNDILQRLPLETSIIVIARLGVKDRKAGLNRRRLHNVRAYLTLGSSEEYRRSPQSIILAEGESTKGYGHVAIYLDGRLIEVLVPYSNSDLAVAGCYDWVDGQDGCVTARQKLFYPCKDKIKPTRKQRPKSRKT